MVSASFIWGHTTIEAGQIPTQALLRIYLWCPLHGLVCFWQAPQPDLWKINTDIGAIDRNANRLMETRSRSAEHKPNTRRKHLSTRWIKGRRPVMARLLECPRGGDRGIDPPKEPTRPVVAMRYNHYSRLAQKRGCIIIDSGSCFPFRWKSQSSQTRVMCGITNFGNKHCIASQGPHPHTPILTPPPPSVSLMVEAERFHSNWWTDESLTVFIYRARTLTDLIYIREPY